MANDLLIDDDLYQLEADHVLYQARRLQNYLFLNLMLTAGNGKNHIYGVVAAPSPHYA
jgi:hypothetical protein